MSQQYSGLPQSDDTNGSRRMSPNNIATPPQRRRSGSSMSATWVLFAITLVVSVAVAISKSRGDVGMEEQQAKSVFTDNDNSTSSLELTTKAPTVRQVEVSESVNASDNSDDSDIADADENDLAISKPSQSPTAPLDTGVSCSNRYDCISDRLAQNEPLKHKQAICSRDDRYMFGMDNGVLMWKDCTNGEVKKYYEGDKYDSFVMDETAKFIVHGDNGNVKWERPCKRPVQKYDLCLSKPAYDCPYLHLHKGGVVVLNYIAINNGWDWISKNINSKKLYEF